MLENLLHKDKQLLIFLNNLGNDSWDNFWLFVTNQLNWAPVFLVILGLIYWSFGLKKGTFIFIFIILLIAFSDQLTNLMKNFTQRIRPCNEADLRGLLREFSYKPGGYSFWSGHANLSTTFSVFIILLLKDKFKAILFLILFPILFGYSRIYLGVHYPVDVFTGYCMGVLMGYSFYKLLNYFSVRLFKTKLI